MRLFALRLTTGLAMLTCSALAFAQTSWTTVVNNGTTMPDTSLLFNSYNQPSINDLGTVVFRARSKGGSGNEPMHGIYMRNISEKSFDKSVILVFDKASIVPSPNNDKATFIEFPSFPRIDQSSDNIITRGVSQPVLTYSTPDGDTKAGTSGVYALIGKKDYTAASQLGIVSNYDYFQVPGQPVVTKFDQFPGAPSITGNLVVFKGNYTFDNASKTGIYYRDFTSKGGKNPVIPIADSSTLIPGQEEGGTQTFGATAPPTAAGNNVVFTGWDDEAQPTMGGVYLAPISPDPNLTTLAYIGEQVPGEDLGVTFTNFGESLSYDGRYVAFWAAWGAGNRSIHLTCPVDGNKDLVAFCNESYPNGYNASVPVHQGIFVYDTQTQELTALAKSPDDFNDFLYWVFSGKPPNTGSGDELDGEPARWRASSFVAVYNGQVIFKAQKPNVDGIYLANGPDPSPIITLIDTNTPGTVVDPQAPAGSTVISLGIEREGYRAGWVAITAGMLDSATAESWVGVYATYLP